MTRDHYVPTSALRSQAWEAALAYEETGLRVHSSVERALRAEILRRDQADHCDVCGYDGSECLCIGTVKGRPVLLINELEANCKGTA